MVDARVDNVYLAVEDESSESLELKKQTYNPTYNVYAQDVDLDDEKQARLKDMEKETEGMLQFQNAVMASLKREIGEKCDIDKDGYDVTERQLTLTEDEKIMLEKLRKVVEVCTEPDPTKRPTANDILDMLEM
ncbi:uncharacterized protein LOC144434504 [Glandiceps talaboti]